MTKEELASLKAGDVVRYIEMNKEYVLTEDGFTITDFNGTPLLYIGVEGTNGNWNWLPYFYYELELVSSKPVTCKCTCDVMLLMRLGCKCGGV